MDKKIRVIPLFLLIIYFFKIIIITPSFVDGFVVLILASLVYLFEFKLISKELKEIRELISKYDNDIKSNKTRIDEAVSSFNAYKSFAGAKTLK